MKKRIIGIIYMFAVALSILYVGIKANIINKSENSSPNKIVSSKNIDDVNTTTEVSVEATESDVKEVDENNISSANVVSEDGDNFFKFGEEWKENDIGVRVIAYSEYDDVANIPEELKNSDYWEQGIIPETGQDLEYKFVTVEVTNYSSEERNLCEEGSNLHCFVLKGIQKEGDYIDDEAALVYNDKCLGNDGIYLQNFGDIALKSNEKVTVHYGFSNFVRDSKYDWYLSDYTCGTSVNATDQKNTAFMCLTE